MQKDINNLLNEIVECFRDFGIEKLILFGSYAHGQPSKDSDLDLLVVTKDEHMPMNFSEKASLDIAISQVIDHMRAKFPIDLIVHTKAMHRKFLQLNSQFCREIQRTGEVLYENEH